MRGSSDNQYVIVLFTMNSLTQHLS